MKKIISLFCVSLMMLFLNFDSLKAQDGTVKEKPKEPNLFAAQRAPKPGPGYVWADGEWKYNKKKEMYDWEDGKWMKEKDGHAWVRGNWERSAGGYKWIPGHWKKKM